MDACVAQGAPPAAGLGASGLNLPRGHSHLSVRWANRASVQNTADIAGSAATVSQDVVALERVGAIAIPRHISQQRDGLDGHPHSEQGGEAKQPAGHLRHLVVAATVTVTVTARLVVRAIAQCQQLHDAWQRREKSQ